MAMFLDQIVPWGRSREEYDLMFGLADTDLLGGVLDCGGGPSSFTAELSASSIRAVSVDPIYAYSGSEIQQRFEASVEPVLSQVRAQPEQWAWSYHRDPEDLCAHRRAALERFLSDYEDGLREHRYIAGELPTLPFGSGSFNLAVCSHLLFLYTDLLACEFHIRSVLEMCRVAGEVRLFPLLTLGGQVSPHVEPVRSALASKGWSSQVIPVAYELQRGGNQMLRCTPQSKTQ